MSRARPSRRQGAGMTTASSIDFASCEPHPYHGERLAAQEVTMDFLRERVSGHAERLNRHDQRFDDGRRRMDEIDDRLRATTRELGPLLLLSDRHDALSQALSPLPSRVKDAEDRITSVEGKIEDQSKRFTRYRDAAFYFVGTLLLSLLLSGRMTLDQLGKIVGAIVKALP